MTVKFNCIICSKCRKILQYHGCKPLKEYFTVDDKDYCIEHEKEILAKIKRKKQKITINV